MRKSITLTAAFLLLVAMVGVGRADEPRMRAMEHGGTGPEGSTEVAHNGYRLSGADRYATAVKVSQATWEDGGAATVFLVNGERFADALAIGSLANLGPILYVLQNELPAIVAEEIERLQPCDVVAVGGAGVIADSVVAQAAEHTQDCEEDPFQPPV